MVSISKLIIYGLVGAFALSALIDPARAQGTIGAFSGVGTALGSLGAGIKSLGAGVGFGAASLFNPLFTLKDLIYGPNAGVQTQTTIRDGTSTGIISNSAGAERQIQLDPNAPITYIPSDYTYNDNWDQVHYGGGAIPASNPLGVPFYTDLSGNSVANVSVFGRNLPLTQSAINYYQAAGVTVSPQNPSTVSSQNSGNATSTAASVSSSSSGANTSSLGGGFGASPATGGFGAAN